MKIVREKGEMRSWSRTQRFSGRRIALVPTMGFLHAGHLSLIREAKKRADLVVVSIYVNPGQFAPGEDLATYPKDFEGDLKKLEPIGVDVVFNPNDLYARDTSNHRNFKGHETWISVERLEMLLCGKSRPIFFRGVTTVVAKLFNIVEPDVAIFGKKDYQQLQVIRCMVRDLDFAVDIVGCDLVREPDGLAMSSRNALLSPAERQQALSISKSLNKVATMDKSDVDVCDLIKQVQQDIVEAGGKVDYVEIVEQESLTPVERIDCPVILCVAAWFGSVRLIDNVEL
eukprot:c22142_g1_i2 orf=85-939(+)